MIKAPFTSKNTLEKPNEKIYEGRKGEIDYLISGTRREHLTVNRVIFKHPTYKFIGSDIWGKLYYIKDEKFIAPENGNISFKCTLCKTIKTYGYKKFSKECLHVIPSEYESEDESEDE